MFIVVVITAGEKESKLTLKKESNEMQLDQFFCCCFDEKEKLEATHSYRRCVA
jgi:hypothetical protein